MANSSSLDRRLVAVSAHIDALVGLMRQGHVVRERIECVEGVPADAALVSVREDSLANCVLFVFHHPSFAPVPDSEILPRRRVNLRSFDDGRGPLNRVPNSVPELSKALVDSLDGAQVQVLQKLLILVGSQLPEDAQPSQLAAELAKYLSERTY